MDVRAELERIWKNTAQRRWLLNRIRERAPAGTDPRDVLQEAALRVLEYAEEGRHIGNVYAFLVTTALRICIDLHRSALRRHEVVPAQPEDEEMDFWQLVEGSADIPDPEMRLKWDFAHEKLSGARRKCYLMRELLGMSFEEIAQLLGLSLEYTVKTYVVAKEKEAEYVRGLSQEEG